MLNGIGNIAYLGASTLFILSLRGLSNPVSARRGNLYGMLGMLVAIAATLLIAPGVSLAVVLVCAAAGATLGALLAKRVEMTQMPQLVAVLHSFVGLAAVVTAVNSYLAPLAGLAGAARVIHECEI